MWCSCRWLSLGGRARSCPRMRAAAQPTRVRLLLRPVCHCAVRASTSTKGVGEGQRWRVEISPIASVTSPAASPFTARAPQTPNAPAETGPQGSDSGRGILIGCCCATRWERAFDGHVWIEDARYERWQNKRACRCRTSPRTTFPVAKRLNTLVLAAEAMVPATHAALPDAVQASIEQRCMNPLCTKLCNWPRPGRPRLFCCRECRQAYDCERAELLADTRTIAEALDRPGGTYKQRRTLQTELARRRWCLIRYGDLRDPEMP